MARQVKGVAETQRRGRRTPPRRLCELIRKLRVSRGLSQSELARRIGSSSSYLCRIEAGERMPSPPMMLKMSRALGCEYGELLAASGVLESDALPRRSGQPSIREEIEELKRVVSALVGYDAYLPRTDEAAVARRPIPVLDEIAAGLLPDEEAAINEDVRQLVLAEDELSYDPLAFALTVTGDSMVNAGILEGDILVVSPSTLVKSGDIAVVMVEEAASVKTVYFEDDKVLLSPGNLRYHPALLKYPGEVQILGKVILLRRKLMD